MVGFDKDESVKLIILVMPSFKKEHQRQLKVGTPELRVCLGF